MTSVIWIHDSYGSEFARTKNNPKIFIIKVWAGIRLNLFSNYFPKNALFKRISPIESNFFVYQSISTHQVCAVGKLPCVGAVVIWNLGLSSAKPPGGSCEHPVVNWSSRAMCSCVKLATIVQNQSSVCKEKSIFC